jgi:hypothetical protein
MPRPSQFIADQFQEVDQSLAGEDRSGEIEARSFQNLGKGLEQFGAGMGQYMENKRRLDDRMGDDDATNFGLEAGQIALDDALTNSQANGDDLIENFDASYNEATEEYIAGLSDDRAKDRARLIFQKQRLARTEGLFAKKRERHLTHTLAIAEKNRRNYTNQVLKDPSQFSLALKSVKDMNESLAVNGAIREDKLETVQMESTKDLIQSSINGMTLLGEDYDAAIFDVNFGRFSALLSTKEKEEYTKIIQNRKITATDIDLKEIKKEEAEAAKLRTEAHRENFQSLMTAAVTATSPEQRASIARRADMFLTNDGMNRVDADYIKAYISKPKLVDFDDKTRSFHITSMLVNGEKPLSEINEIIKRDVINGNLHPDTGQSLLTKSQAIKDRQTVTGADIYKEKMRLAKEQLDALYGNHQVLIRLPGRRTEQLLKRNQAGQEFLNKLVENPDIDPIRAADIVAQELSGLDINAYPPVPGIPSDKQSKESDLVKEMAKIQARFENGAISQSKRDETLILIDQRIKQIRELEKIKMRTDAKALEMMTKRKQNNIPKEEAE